MFDRENADIEEIVDGLISSLSLDNSGAESGRWAQISNYVLCSLPDELSKSIKVSPWRYRPVLQRAVQGLVTSDESFCSLLHRTGQASSGMSVHIQASQNAGLVFGDNSGYVAGGNIVGTTPRGIDNKRYSQDSHGASIRILFLGSSPDDLSRLRLDQEVRQIDLALRTGEFRDHFFLSSHWAVRPNDLQACLLRHRPNIVHFSGHGSAEQAIFLEDESGRRCKVDGDVLARLLGVFKSSVRCVVLNACYSADQAKAIAQQVDCVVGMSTAVGDQAAISFAASFYQALAFGDNVANAFELGCVQIALDGQRQEVDTPRLIALRQNAAQIVFAK